MKAVTFTVPASTANLGPGFDCLGLALGLHNEVELSPAEEGVEVEIEGEGADRLARDRSNLILQAAWRAFERIRRSPAGLRLRSVNRIPLSSGLGSSAAAVVGGLAAANAMAGGGLTREEILTLAFEMEGHADNAAAALYGGLTLVTEGPEGLVARRTATPAMHVVVVTPELRLSTEEMRRALPDRVPLSDASYNLGHLALTIEALRSGDYELLARAVDDRLHQPYRKRFIPGYEEVVAAARRSGAVAVALSGAGPSLVAFAPAGYAAIAQAAADAFASSGLRARSFVLPVDQIGLRPARASRT